MRGLPVITAFVFLSANFVLQAQDGGSPEPYVSPGFEHRLFFAPGDPVLDGLAAARAIRRTEDYGAFVLAIVDERLVGGRHALLALGADVRDDQAVIGINGMPLDTADAAGLAARLASIPDGLRAEELDAAPAGERLWLVQFIGPIRDEWLARLRAAGAAIVSPMATNAYVVSVGAASFGSFVRLLQDSSIQWIGPYHPYFRIAPELRALDFAQAGSVDVTIQLVADRGEAGLRAALEAGFPRLGPVETVLGYVDLRLAVPVNLIPSLAADPAVFGIEPFRRYQQLDEQQDQIVAGNLNATQAGASAPGYLAWLASKGFASGQFNFVIDITDSGIDRGSLVDVNDEFKVLGPGGASRVVYLNNYSLDPTADCANGHGNLGASIMAGYNALSGSAYEDASLYNYGLGVCPFVPFGGTKVFSNLGVPDFTAAHTVRIAAAYTAGARVSNNAWGTLGLYAYTADCQVHDALVRDASIGAFGNQEMTIVFAAGNDGSGVGTVLSPAQAKNVISAGASENNRPGVTDGCNIPATGANNAMDIINFSSRGPCADMRKKPDIMAPGTHVQGALSRSLSYNGTGVCNYNYPQGQNLYTWSSGTSFSSPAITGACALVRQYFVNQGWGTPSPAMLKAYLMGSTRHMTGLSANDTLWSNNQGMGLVDLGKAFDGGARALVDQTHTFTASGQTHVVTGTIASAAAPFRVALAWTDTPGPITGNAYVNNLDLQVVVNGTTYRGNVFTGASSTSGGTADPRNNAEFVFLPAGTSGTFTVTVTATNVAGDGVPGNSDLTDQDFALVVFNGTGCLPAISSVSPPSIAPPLATPVVLTVTGSCFLPNSVVHANCVPLTTTYVNATTLTCTLPASVPQTQIAGALCINVENNASEVSNSVALVVGAGGNAGTIRRHPLVPTPGGTYAILIEGGVPNAPFSLFGDLGTVAPVSAWPHVFANFVLSISPLTGSAGPLVTVFDGLGVFGPPGPFVLDAAGNFAIYGITLPQPAIGITATLQAAYVDPTSTIGLRLTWARFPETL
jgi:Subtilase family